MNAANQITEQVNLAQDVHASEMEGKYLTFHMDNQLFGVPTADVVQIVGIQEIIAIPEYPAYAKGVVNLRGSIIPVIDARLRFGKVERAYDERTCIIVMVIGGEEMGLIVDEVYAVTSISDEDISAPPQISADKTSPYLMGIAKLENRVVLILSASKLLSEDAVEIIINTNIGGA